MKITKSSVAIILLLFFFAFSTNAEPVLDIDGDEIRTGLEYYVVSTIRGAGGGGLDLGSPIDQWCPKFVIQRNLDLDFGRPVTFWPTDNNASVVHLSTDLNVVFVPGLDAYCRQSTQWKLDDYDPSTGKWWVTTGASRGEAGPNTLMNWFKIEKLRESAYKFSFCPSVCDSCITLCNDVSRDLDKDGQIRLALSPQGWSFHFIKVSRVIKQVA